MMSSRPKILLSCYACEPNKGSEPEVGWRVAQGAVDYADVTVLTRSNNQETIDASKESTEGISFLYFDLPRVFRVLKKKGILGVGLYYVLWQIAARIWFRERIKKFDLVHHVTFNGFQFPGAWWGIDQPILLGPLGGGMVFPAEMLGSLGSGRSKERLRTAIVRSFKWNPFWVSYLRSADRVLGANVETAKLLESVRGGEVEMMLETGYEVSGERTKVRDEVGSCEVLWVGGLISRKCPVMAIEIAERMFKNDVDFKMTIIGDGPMMGELRALIREKKLESCIRLTGKIPKEEVERRMEKADVFLFTSMRDTSGNVLLEAMARELPLDVPKHQCAALICSDEHAVLFDAVNPEQFVEHAAAGIRKLAEDQGLRKRMGAEGRRRLETNFSWNRYHSRMKCIYEEILGR